MVCRYLVPGPVVKYCARILLYRDATILLHLLVGAPAGEAEGAAQEVAHRLGPLEVVPSPVALRKNACGPNNEIKTEEATLFSRISYTLIKTWPNTDLYARPLVCP